ncbi:PREDICTED: uncharacterized protein DDB_G0290685-like [Branchiostoma belcheri]|uniref:Uncharacterized protein DDB_G0290685-like n=1 Tax=Branchiostoma belcheri TaxID=7741 RepID=A0A6P4YBV9_BRABE|nr:PREDICTED: uncharacterized protein DDB_G0290685-like [Branchiostoma belcheri]
MQLLLVFLAVLQMYILPRGGATAGSVEKEACPGGNCESSYSFNNDDVLIRKQRYARGPGGGRTDSDRQDDSDGVQIETVEWDEDDIDRPHYHGQSEIYKAVLLQTDPEDDQPAQKPPLAENDIPPDQDLDDFKARSAPMAEDKADGSTDTVIDKDRDEKDETLTSEASEDKGSSKNKNVESKKKRRKSGKRDHDDFSDLHFHRMSSLYQTVMTKGELEEEEETKGSEVTGQSNGEGQDDDLDLDESKNGDEKGDDSGLEEPEDLSDTTANQDNDLNVDKESFNVSEDKGSPQNLDVEPKKKRKKRNAGKRDHDDYTGLHFHRMSSLYQTVMTKGELEEEEEVNGSKVTGQTNDEGQGDIDKESGSDKHECSENCNCPSCQKGQQETEESSEDEDNEDGGGVKSSEEDGGGVKSSEEDGGGATSEEDGGGATSEEDGGRATNSEEDEVYEDTDQRPVEKLNEEETQDKERESAEEDTPINVKDYISRMLVKYRDERLVHTHTDDP